MGGKLSELKHLPFMLASDKGLSHSSNIKMQILFTDHHHILLYGTSGDFSLSAVEQDALQATSTTPSAIMNREPRDQENVANVGNP